MNFDQQEEPKMSIKKVVSVKYECECGSNYDSKEEAERCSAPKDPQFKIGDWVETNKYLTMPNSAYDGGFGDEDTYDNIPEGTMARIFGVHDDYDLKKARHPQQSFRYTFDKGDFPMMLKSMFEGNLRPASRETLQNKINKTSEALKRLEDIADEL